MTWHQPKLPFLMPDEVASIDDDDLWESEAGQDFWRAQEEHARAHDEALAAEHAYDEDEFDDDDPGI